MSWKLRPRARNDDYGSSSEGEGSVIFYLVVLPFLLIGLIAATVPFLIISVVIIIFMILKKKSQPKSSLDPTRYGIKGGRYEMRISKKTGRPYRHYF